MNTAVSVRLPKDLLKELDQIAQETERPRSFIIQKALESYLEDQADLQIALDRFRDKSDKVISAKELRKVPLAYRITYKNSVSRDLKNWKKGKPSESWIRSSRRYPNTRKASPS